jgi:hypothetical protein
MTARSGMSAAGPRILDLLTASEAAAELGPRMGRRCSVRTVRRLAAEGVLVRVMLGTHARYTPESVAAYKQRLIAEAQAAKAS